MAVTRNDVLISLFNLAVTLLLRSFMLLTTSLYRSSSSILMSDFIKHVYEEIDVVITVCDASVMGSIKKQVSFTRSLTYTSP